MSAGQVFPLDRTEIVIGRSRKATVCLDDQGVSRVHCKIFERDGELYLEDRESTNGTVVNGARACCVRLGAGDRIQVGPSVVLQLAYIDDTEEALATRLFDASTKDPLTRAFNRRYFYQRIEVEIAHAARHKTPLSVLLLDLDLFKSINDKLGHAAGDHVLRTVVDELTKCIRVEDVLTRYGGEEFAILVRGYGIDGARRFAERLRSRIEALRMRIESTTLVVTTSVGVAELNECTHATGDELLALADRRLYRAKLLGRNRVCAE